MFDLLNLYRFTPFLLSVTLDRIIFLSMNVLLSESQISLIDLISLLLNVSNHKGAFFIHNSVISTKIIINN